MILEIDNKLNIQYPLGATFLHIRGATQNLGEAISSNDRELILMRRNKLSEALRGLVNISYRRPINDSFVASRLIHNLEEAKLIATSMLSDASSKLSASLVLA